MKKIYTLFSLFCVIYCFSQNEFITLWKPNNPSYLMWVGNQMQHTTNSQVYFPGVGTDYTIYWEEAGFPSHNGILNHVTSTVGNAVLLDFGTPVNPNTSEATYYVKVSNGSGNFSQMVFHGITSEGPTSSYGDTQKILDIVQWGNINWKKIQFTHCDNLDCTATDTPVFLPGCDLSRLFYQCTRLRANSQINNWDTTNVTNMSWAFYNADLFNESIANWNTSNVTNMSTMFFSANIFNQDITDWDTSKVTDMSYMFSGALAFNQNIGKWNTLNVTNMSHMFEVANSFNQSLNNWNTSKVTNMESMFQSNTIFNGDIGGWDTSSVRNMYNMFLHALRFDKPIGSWNTSNVTNMASMFYEAFSFNQPIGNWNTSNVTDMTSMFGFAILFNQNIENWDTTNVRGMGAMFLAADKFNQNLGKWNLKNLTTSGLINNFMLYGSGMDCNNYNKTLIGWANNINTPSNILFNGNTPMVYSSNEAVSARNYLINTKNWQIAGDTYDPGCNSSLATQEVQGSKIQIYPNPVKDIINFRTPEKIKKIEICDLSGRLIETGSNFKDNRIDVSVLRSGNYILKLITDKNTYHSKFIKE